VHQLIRHKIFKKDLAKATISDQQFTKMIQWLSELSQGNALPPEANDHDLAGNWKEFREFHLGGDLLIIYRNDPSNNQIILVRIGSHSQLFK